MLVLTAVIPVIITGGYFGILAGVISAAAAVILRGLFGCFQSTGAPFSNILIGPFLIEWIYLTVVGAATGLIQACYYQTRQEYQLLEATSQHIRTYSNLLQVVHQVSTELTQAKTWRSDLVSYLQQLAEATEVDRAYFLEFQEVGPDHLTGILYAHPHEDGKAGAKDSPIREVSLPFPDTNLQSWTVNAQEGMAILGQIQDLSPPERESLNTIPEGSFVVYPVMGRQQIQGMIGFEKSVFNLQWEKTTLDALGMLAHILGSIITRQQIQNDLRSRVRELDTLHLASQHSTSQEQLDSTLKTILKQIFVLVPADHASIYLTRDKQLTLLISAGSPAENQLGPIQELEHQLMDEILKDRDPLVIANSSTHPLSAESTSAAGLEPGSMVALPLNTPSGMIGALTVWYPDPHRVQESELKLLRLLANQASSTILAAEYYRAEEEQRQLENSLRDARKKLISELDLNQVLESILEQVLTLTSAQIARIYFYDGTQLEFGAVKGRLEGKPDSSFLRPDNHTFTLEVAQTGELTHLSTQDQEEVQHPGKDSELSRVGIPLTFNQQVIGVMTVTFPDGHPDQKRTLQILQLLSDQAVIAINNARIYEKEREQRQLAEALGKTSQIIMSSLNVETVLDKILAQIETVVPYDTMNLMLVEGEVARIVRHQGYQEQDPDMLSVIEGKTLKLDSFDTLQKMIVTREPLIISDTQTDPQWVNIQSSAQISSWVGAPLIEKERVMGFLSLNKFDRNFYQPEHGRILKGFANQAAIAIKHAQLYQAEAQRRREAERLRTIQESLLNLSRAIGSVVDFDRISELVISYVQDLLPVDHALLFRRAQDGEAFLPVITQATAWDDIQVTLGQLQNYSLSHLNAQDSPLLRDVLDTKSPVLIHNPADSPFLAGEIQQAFHLTSLIAAPLISQDEVLGVLYGGCTTQQRSFSDQDLQFFTGLADQAAVALERTRLFQEIQEKAVTDPLTGIYNRRGLFQWGQYELDRARRFGHPLAVIFFDLDHFKEINDTHGHEAGDQVLQEITERCLEVIRQVDIPSRYGGEEFVIVLPETEQTAAQQIGERIRKAVASGSYHVNAHQVEMTISLGVTELDEDIHQLDQIINRADQAMYRAKQAGRNRTEVF